MVPPDKLFFFFPTPGLNLIRVQSFFSSVARTCLSIWVGKWFRASGFILPGLPPFSPCPQLLNVLREMALSFFPEAFMAYEPLGSLPFVKVTSPSVNWRSIDESDSFFSLLGFFPGGFAPLSDPCLPVSGLHSLTFSVVTGGPSKSSDHSYFTEPRHVLFPPLRGIQSYPRPL